ncbi:hypothetical protein [Emticicia sp. BO119]|uniref:hypothetical protein n=1 Tax=Emticicia sp. BO119 TaxID=2757768 RepID=UPI0015F0BE7A|nr:hypothetical protein [Emticicia sp. BO119]MBA4851361.1 hypothetical protein [Emticicia sp. BO119]
MNHTILIWAFASVSILLFMCCLLLSIKLYKVMADNATLQYQNACFTAETAQEKTFVEIFNDLTKILKEIRQVNRQLENQGLNIPLKQG